MKLIGKGSFTRAYQKDSSTVLLKSTDPIKECMALGWFPSSQLFPVITRTEHGEYEMKYYHKVNSLKDSLVEAHYSMYKTLRHTSDTFKHPQNNYDMLDAWRAQFKLIKNRRLREAVTDALNACSNYGSDVGFEISPRNVAVTSTGKLILLDCFYMQSKLDETRKR